VIEGDRPPTALAESVSPDVEIASVVELLPGAITSVPTYVEPLLSRALPHDAVLSLVDAHHMELRPEPPTFDVGSSRDAVIAAQGAPPTYSLKNGSMLWWGSSKVSFTRDGHVTSWVQGTPTLNVGSARDENAASRKH
jgi:hypothetical protein